MNASNLDFVSSQNKSRIIKIITYISKGKFQDYYNPSKIIICQFSLNSIEKIEKSQYEPSLVDRSNVQSRGKARTPIRNDYADTGKFPTNRSVQFKPNIQEDNIQ